MRSNLKRGMKIFILSILNPHRFLLALAQIILIFPEWLDDKADKASDYLSNLEAKTPLFGKSIRESLKEDYRQKYLSERRRISRQAAKSVMSGKSDERGQR